MKTHAERARVWFNNASGIVPQDLPTLTALLEIVARESAEMQTHRIFVHHDAVHWKNVDPDCVSCNLSARAQHPQQGEKEEG